MRVLAIFIAGFFMLTGMTVHKSHESPIRTVPGYKLEELPDKGLRLQIPVEYYIYKSVIYDDLLFEIADIGAGVYDTDREISGAEFFDIVQQKGELNSEQGAEVIDFGDYRYDVIEKGTLKGNHVQWHYVKTEDSEKAFMQSDEIVDHYFYYANMDGKAILVTYFMRDNWLQDQKGFETILKSIEMI